MEAAQVGGERGLMESFGSTIGGLHRPTRFAKYTRRKWARGQRK